MAIVRSVLLASLVGKFELVRNAVKYVPVPLIGDWMDRDAILKDCLAKLLPPDLQPSLIFTEDHPQLPCHFKWILSIGKGQIQGQPAERTAEWILGAGLLCRTNGVSIGDELLEVHLMQHISKAAFPGWIATTYPTVLAVISILSASLALDGSKAMAMLLQKIIRLEIDQDAVSMQVLFELPELTWKSYRLRQIAAGLCKSGWLASKVKALLLGSNDFQEPPVLADPLLGRIIKMVSSTADPALVSLAGRALVQACNTEELVKVPNQFSCLIYRRQSRLHFDLQSLWDRIASMGLCPALGQEEGPLFALASRDEAFAQALLLAIHAGDAIPRNMANGLCNLGDPSGFIYALAKQKCLTPEYLPVIRKLNEGALILLALDHLSQAPPFDLLWRAHSLLQNVDHLAHMRVRSAEMPNTISDHCRQAIWQNQQWQIDDLPMDTCRSDRAIFHALKFGKELPRDLK